MTLIIVTSLIVDPANFALTTIVEFWKMQYQQNNTQTTTYNLNQLVSPEVDLYSATVANSGGCSYCWSDLETSIFMFYCKPLGGSR